jgi:LysM repeat protein
MPTSTNTKVRNLREKREALKAQAPRRRKSKRTHTMPANVTNEGQWSSGEPPQVKTSRMFLGMLALHLVAVGGLVAFHFYGHDPVADAPAAKAAIAATTPIKDRSAAPATPLASTNTPRQVPVARTPAPVAHNTFDYMVRMDETWESIALARGISADDLRQANPDIELNVGRLVKIPMPRLITGSGNSRPEAKPVITQPSSVRPGGAYNQYAPNPEQVAAAQISAEPPTKAPRTTIGGPVKANATAASTSKTTLSGKSYTVAKGETLFGIAKRRGVSEKALMRYNGISDASKLRVGQKIKLPPAD